MLLPKPPHRTSGLYRRQAGELHDDERDRRIESAQIFGIRGHDAVPAFPAANTTNASVMSLVLLAPHS